MPSAAACVLVNEDGWIVTAKHVVEAMDQALEMEKVARQRDAIKANRTLSNRQRQQALAKLPRSKVDRAAVSWGHPHARPEDVIVSDTCDLAAVHLSNLSIPSGYKPPKFRKDVSPGEFLRRVGYALLEDKLQAVWHADKQQFELNATPPLFVNSGIVSRFLSQPNGEVRLIEIDSPGLNGQSGGPLIDREGGICGIQSATSHYPLTAMDPKIPNQFYHVGVAVHAETVRAFLKENGIRHGIV